MPLAPGRLRSAAGCCGPNAADVRARIATLNLFVRGLAVQFREDKFKENATKLYSSGQGGAV